MSTLREMNNLKEEIEKVLDEARTQVITSTRMRTDGHDPLVMDIHKWQAEAIVEWLEKKKAGLRETIYDLLVKALPAHTNSLHDCRIYADAISAALVPIPPLQIPPFTDDDADRAFREDERDREITHLTKELEEKVIQCCKRDHDHDGNCDQHPVGWAQKLQAEVEAARAELERRGPRTLQEHEWRIWEQVKNYVTKNGTNPVDDIAAFKGRAKFLPGDSVFVLYDGKITRGKIWAVREAVLRITVSGVTMDFHPEDAHATAEECRASIPVEEST